jgi:YidC/Oxa1 family membrane protein insertase
MKNQRLLFWLFLGLIALSVFQNFSKNGDSALEVNSIGIVTDRNDYAEGKTVALTVQNNTPATITLQDACGDLPFEIAEYKDGEWAVVSGSYEEECETPDTVIEIAAGEKESFNYKNWTYRLFGESGRYRIEMQTAGKSQTTSTETIEAKTLYSNEFSFEERGFFSSLWLEFVYRPTLNTLVFLIEVLPGHSLGFAIILLTLLIRTLLLIPSQRAMRSQKKMQEIQPKIEELKKKYKDNQELMAMETMKLWQTHKVNPFGSCMMILVQFPILIALYQVVQSGLHPDKFEILYDFVGTKLDFAQINANFLGILDLTQINFIVLPLIVGALQYVQMHLALARAKKKKEVKKEVDKKVLEKVESTDDLQNQMQMATNMMKYVMPAMIAFFTASVPAGVGLYWGVSTTYGIVQQLVVNKESTKEKEQTEPVVKVIEKS